MSDPLHEPSPEHRRGRTRHRRKRRGLFSGWKVDFALWLPLLAFAAIAFLAPLLFGAVDRIVQVALVSILALGLFFAPPSRPALSRSATLFAAALATLLIAKEVAPSALFGSVRWRGELQVPLPWTHHPEPARVLDGLLVVAVALLWFQWVRTLAAHGARRVWMAWLLAASGVTLALVCFGLKVDPARPTAIYGIRETEGWIGWGPFPNRNHTSSFLAMAGVCMAGCLWWAVLKKRKPFAVAGGVGLLIILGALLAGKSRGGLLAFGVGLCVLLALAIWRKRDRKTILVALIVLAVAAAGVAVFGGKVLERFRSAEAGLVSNETRVLIWKEALGMWRDAPLFGHGVDTFTQLFPLYQRFDLDGKTVLHPESSWLQWLAELGALPVALLAGALGWFILRNLRLAMAQRREFYLTAGLLAGAVALFAHAVIDVPGHRWATAGFALALLAVAFPVREAVPSTRFVALAPAGIAAFWVLPFLGLTLSWSPLAPTMLLNRETRPGSTRPTLADWESSLRWFPLDDWMHQYAGLRALEAAPTARARWEPHFAAARRLLPSAWWIPQMQARAVAVHFPAEAIGLWQDAIDRAGRQWSELLRTGVRETSRVKGALVLWGQFVETRPALALTYAQVLVEELRQPDANVRGFFDIWWERSAMGPISDDDASTYYRYAARWSSPAELETWMAAHPARAAKDFRSWVALFHGWKQSARAWELYKSHVPQPAEISPTKGATRKSLEDKWRVAPDNASHALELAHLLEREGDLPASTRVLMDAARSPSAAPRVLREAAYRLAQDGKLPEAVEMALRENPNTK